MEAASQSSNPSSSSNSSCLDSTPLWKYFKKIGKGEGGGNSKMVCNFCERTFNGSYPRVKAHLLGLSGFGIRTCDKIIPEEVEHMKKMQNDAEIRIKNMATMQVPLPSTTLSDVNPQLPPAPKKRKNVSALEKAYNLQIRTQIDEEIARMFYTGCPSFNLSRNPHFINAFKFCAENNVVGYKPPSYNKLRTTLLDNERSHVEKLLEPIKRTWQSKGVTVVSDGWTDIQRRPLINFIAITDGSPVFLKAINCQGEYKDKNFIAERIREVIEEIGSQNVVQVITDNAPVCRAAGMLIEAKFSHIFWTPCVVHTLNLALKNICAAKNTEANSVVYDECSWISILVSNVFAIKTFIMNHSMRLAMYKYHSSLKLLYVAETRFASMVVMLRRFKLVKGGLIQLVIDSRWSTYRDGYESRANFVREKILDEMGFWKQVEYILDVTEPIYDMLRKADTDKPCLHLVYEMWDSMIAKVKRVVYQKEGKMESQESPFYSVVHSILTDRWSKSTAPLHCLAHSLNPKYYEDIWLNGRVAPHMDMEISNMRNQCLQNFFPDLELRREVIHEYGRFSICGGGFEMHDAINFRSTIDPLTWWINYGVSAPKLQALAMKLLCQPASSSCCERNWSTYSFIHSAKRNKMTPQRAEDLVFVHSNLRLLSRRSEEYLSGETRMWDVGGDQFEPFDGAELLQLANLSLDEPELERFISEGHMIGNIRTAD